MHWSHFLGLLGYCTPYPYSKAYIRVLEPQSKAKNVLSGQGYYVVLGLFSGQQFRELNKLRISSILTPVKTFAVKLRSIHAPLDHRAISAYFAKCEESCLNNTLKLTPR